MTDENVGCGVCSANIPVAKKPGRAYYNNQHGDPSGKGQQEVFEGIGKNEWRR